MLLAVLVKRVNRENTKAILNIVMLNIPMYRVAVLSSVIINIHFMSSDSIGQPYRASNIKNLAILFIYNAVNVKIFNHGTNIHLNSNIGKKKDLQLSQKLSLLCVHNSLFLCFPCHYL